MDNIDILGNTTESAIQATSQALYDLDHPREYVPKVSKFRRACMKEREFLCCFSGKIRKTKSKNISIGLLTGNSYIHTLDNIPLRRTMIRMLLQREDKIAENCNG